MIRWDGETLYRVEDGAEVEVGYVQPAAFGDGWDVFVRDRYEITCVSQEQAKKVLEGYA